MSIYEQKCYPICLSDFATFELTGLFWFVLLLNGIVNYFNDPPEPENWAYKILSHYKTIIIQIQRYLEEGKLGHYKL